MEYQTNHQPVNKWSYLRVVAECVMMACFMAFGAFAASQMPMDEVVAGSFGLGLVVLVAWTVVRIIKRMASPRRVVMVQQPQPQPLTQPYTVVR